jgi:glycyl-tRNA synthetase
MNNLEKIISLAKRRGFIFSSSEIYGGLAGFYDFGPLGVLLKNNIKDFWLKETVFKRDNVYLLESSLIGSQKLYSASGHLKNFTDPLVECKNCHQRFRDDELIKKSQNDKCPSCGHNSFTEPKNFNLMLKTLLGPVEELSSEAYLRPETAQGIFVNFKNVLNATRTKLPFGIAQIGKSFRNEITPKNFIFKTREFEQMELEFFVKPSEDDKFFDYWVEERFNWYLELGIKKENLQKYPVPKNELAHYSKRTIDIKYNFPFGWSEVEGIANRTDYDLKKHSEFSVEDLNYFDEAGQKKFFPFVIEPSAGIERILLALLCDVYNEDEIEGEKRIVLKFKPFIAPIQLAVFPLLANRKPLIEKAKEIYKMLLAEFRVVYDEIGSIGKRYRRQDEIGTPYCLTIDFESLEKNDLTVRDRDTLKQERIKIEEIVGYLNEKLKQYY